MEDLIKNIFLAGVGSLSIGYDKSKELVDQLIERGQISLEQGRKLNEELKKNLKEDSVEEKQRLIDELNLVSKDDLKNILERLDQLEKNNDQ